MSWGFLITIYKDVHHRLILTILRLIVILTLMLTQTFLYDTLGFLSWMFLVMFENSFILTYCLLITRCFLIKCSFGFRNTMDVSAWSVIFLIVYEQSWFDIDSLSPLLRCVSLIIFVIWFIQSFMSALSGQSYFVGFWSLHWSITGHFRFSYCLHSLSRSIEQGKRGIVLELLRTVRGHRPFGFTLDQSTAVVNTLVSLLEFWLQIELINHYLKV